MHMLDVRKLSIRAGARTLIDAMDWQVRPGEFWCVLGRNGAGKSLLLQVLSGLRAADRGTVVIDGRPIDSIPLPELARLRGLMPQQVNDSFSCAVGDAVAIARTPWRMGGVQPDDEEFQRVCDALAQVGMLDRIDDDICRLSGGERQRVAFAAMLAQDPGLMLLDEPTSHQDVAQQLMLMRLMRQLSGKHAVVATCHDINLVSRFATHVLLLGEGFHRAGSTADVLTPEMLESVFGCKLSRQGDYFVINE